MRSENPKPKAVAAAAAAEAEAVHDRTRQPLSSCHVDQPLAALNRCHTLLHLLATLLLLLTRASSLLLLLRRGGGGGGALLAILSASLLLAADAALAFLWALGQAFRWRPVSRAVFPERLPAAAGEGRLPAVDVFVVTADPEKEPAVQVLNTVMSAMGLDYPADRLTVYLSDDGGSPVTLFAAKEAYRFARAWLPFCRRYQIATRWPDKYFDGNKDGGGGGGSNEFKEEREKLENMYEEFKESVKKAKDEAIASGDFAKSGGDRRPRIEVMKDEQDEEQDHQIPLLVYVAREKRKNYPHHFKAGALNVLLRVSSTISNSPYILVLDCDMSSNDPLSLRQAMCFHLDPRLSPSLAFVQFPQKFHNISKNDIYCSELRFIFKTLWKGCDGLRGPILSGTGFYIRRDALYGAKPGHTSTREEFNSMEMSELKQKFGSSNEFIASLRQKSTSELGNRRRAYTVPQEALLLASCTYENETQWGEQVGFLYGSLVEDYFTGFHLHCRGWTSVYCDPPLKPAFLGNAPTNLHDMLVQNKRWITGLLEVGISKYCPLTFGMRASSWSSMLQSMCYAWLAFRSLYAFPLLVYGVVPQLCFSRGVSVFPVVSSLRFAVFAIVYASSNFQHVMEVIICQRTLMTWWNEQRCWLLIAVTSKIFACVNVFTKLIGAKAIDFDLTNKAVDESQIKMFDDDVFDFRGASMILLPATTLSVLNLGALARGGWRMIAENKFDELFGQFFLSCFIFAVSYPVLEGIFVRRDAGRVPTRIALWSIALSVALLYLFG